MNNNKPPARKLILLMSAALFFLSGTAFSQESVYADLDACVKDEQVSLTVKGAGAGALAGLTAGLFSGKKDNAVKGAAIGAVVGGVAGFATAYYTAIDNCKKKNPSWVTESKIVRTKNYEQVKKDTKYKPSEGVRIEARKIDMAASVKAGATLDINSTFIVLTPNGAETTVLLERKLFVVADGKETELPFTGKASEERTVEPGEQTDSEKLPIPSGMNSGSVLRVEFIVSSTGNKKPSSVSASVTVN